MVKACSTHDGKYTILVTKPERKSYLGDLNIDGR
jgi:hypothetical protein